MGWAMSRTLDTKLAMDALNMAIARSGSAESRCTPIQGPRTPPGELPGNRQPAMASSRA